MPLRGDPRNSLLLAKWVTYRYHRTRGVEASGKSYLFLIDTYLQPGIGFLTGLIDTKPRVTCSHVRSDVMSTYGGMCIEERSIQASHDRYRVQTLHTLSAQ
jgi:hypothetical protein